MALPRALLLAGFLVLPACDRGAADAAAACALVVRFDQALRAGDTFTLRDLVTFESRPAIDALPVAALTRKRPLAVCDASRRADRLHVRVTDPNENGKEGTFVVTRENGELRVDLVASAGLVAREIPLPGPATRTVIRPLAPAERARAAQLAQQMQAPPDR